MKRHVRDLAVFSGVPEFAERRVVGRPHIGSRDTFQAYLNEALDRRWLTNNGPLVREFERRTAEFCGVSHSIATSNATTALQMLIRAARLSGEILVPSFTFPATAHVASWSGVTPTFCDVDLRTGTIDPAHVESMVTSRTSGIIGVHVWGHSCPVDALTDIAERCGLTLLFDAAHAFASTYRGRPIGAFGTAEVFSFHATKLVNAFEGGAITTNDTELADRLRSIRNFGICDDGQVRFVGTNAKMSEVAAAMGLASLDDLPRSIDHNRACYCRYRELLRGAPGIRMLDVAPGERSGHLYVVIQIDQAVSGLNRDELLSVLDAENVVARRQFYPGCHRMPVYRGLRPPSSLPRTEALADSVLSLPTGASVSEGDTERIASIIRISAENGPSVSDRLQAVGGTS